MEFGAYSFGDTQQNTDGSLQSSGAAIANLFEAIVHADDVGLDYFGIGEHHTAEMPASSPAAVVAAAAGATKTMRLGSAVSVLSTDDPVRVYQQFATADAISGGRVEITAGRGSSTESFPLFGYSLNDYDRLYSEKLELLLAINQQERITWSGSVRAPLNDALIVPRPLRGTLPIWLGTGGSAPSSQRAGALGIPISYGIIGGQPARFAPLAGLYRATAKRAGFDGTSIKVSVAALGFISESDEEARDLWYPHWAEVMNRMGRARGFPPPTRDAFEAQAQGPGAFYVGGPDDVARRIVDLHRHLSHSRHFLQMDIGGLPQDRFLRSLELLATEVAPRVRRTLET